MPMMFFLLHHAHCVSAPKNKYINADNTGINYTLATTLKMPGLLCPELFQVKFLLHVFFCVRCHTSLGERLIRCSIRADKTLIAKQ